MISIVISLFVASICAIYYVHIVRRGNSDQPLFDFSLIRTGLVVFIIAAVVVYLITIKDRGRGVYDTDQELEWCDQYNCARAR